MPLKLFHRIFAVCIVIISIVVPVLGTRYVFIDADKTRFDLFWIVLRIFIHTIISFLPFLLILYYKKMISTQENKFIGKDIYTCSILISVIALFLGFLYYTDSYFSVLSEDPNQLSVGMGVIKVGSDIYLPILVLLWGFLGALIYIIQDYIRRIRDENLPSRSIVSSIFRIISALVASTLIYFVMQSSHQVYKFEIPNLDNINYVFDKSQGKIVPDSLVSGIKEVPHSKVIYYQAIKTNNNIISFQYVLAFLSFFAGMFPTKTLTRLIRPGANEKLRSVMGFFFGSTINVPNLSLLQGITVEDEERMLEEGYSSVQRIATESAESIVKNAKYPLHTVRDWTEQAKLICYFENQKILNSLRQVGIRTIKDLEKIKLLSDEDFIKLSEKVPEVDLKLFRIE